MTTSPKFCLYADRDGVAPVTLAERVGVAVQTNMQRAGVKTSVLAARTGISPSTLARRLKGASPFSIAELARVVAELDTTMYAIIVEAEQLPA